MAESILKNLDPGQIRQAPFPHLVAENVLDRDYYAELDAAFPSLQAIAGEGTLANNTLYSRSARDLLGDEDTPPLWRDFLDYHSSQAFLQEFLAFWNDAIEGVYPDLAQRFGKPLSDLRADVRHPGREKTSENLQKDVLLDCQLCMNSPVTEISSVRVPHVDNPFKLFAGLLYFRSPQDDSTGGDLNLYRLTNARYYHDRKLNVPERFIETVETVRYRPNTLILWLNTPHSLHGVTPRSCTQVPRRYVNFIGESYVTRPQGFFPLRRRPVDRAREALRSLVKSS
ncbi:2OG-Fe(II) oxygenase [Fodinicurvata sediminis]|uniref:2OG-Fe(II) oxygenase n=1 Tax=Fodinicurvata sediminis TaxID=1121832 RepID=UPI0003B67781|nr:2OG-Fe(II) oxygenase [Fodinicurvata sediminis]